ncbi:hypothetical protein [Halobacterium rubrum]|uniref:hypothetical protein n=1 Tax=Halobacterium TaxID=2239 RepID=UPI001F24D0AF|nr:MULTISPECIES: hypothetical protein [Halobacterium]MDH5018754.1 hypothetical protein [Halobacterium rubrum]
MASVRQTDDRRLTTRTGAVRPTPRSPSTAANRLTRGERHGFKGRRPNPSDMSTSTKLVVATVAIAAVLSVAVMLQVG